MSKKLLLADDSVTIQRVIGLTFSGEDVEVLTAGDGEEAIARITAERPDIVLADIGMPKRSGYDVSAFVKGRTELSHIPVLLLAGAFEPVDDDLAKEVQCDGVLVKPFEPQQVIARVRELISGAKGSPTQPAVSDIPRPAAVLTPPRPVELPKREEKPPMAAVLIDDEDLLPPPGPDKGLDLMDDLLPRAENLLPHLDQVDSALRLDDSLDDYFDKLDEAFATITTSSAPDPLAVDEGMPWHRRVLDRDLESLEAPSAIDGLPATPGMGRDPLALDAIQPDDASVPTLDTLLAGMSPVPEGVKIAVDQAPELIHVSPPPPIDIPVSAFASAMPASISVSPPPIEAPDVTPTLTPASFAVIEPPQGGRSIIADAFSALLAVEQGEPGAVPIRLRGNGTTPIVTERMIDDVARRVIQKLALGTSDQMQAMVRDVVSGVAERLVREEIDRIRRDAPRN